MIHSCVFCLVIVVPESLVCLEKFNFLLFFWKKIQLPQIIWFSSIFVYFNPFQQWLRLNAWFFRLDHLWALCDPLCENRVCVCVCVCLNPFQQWLWFWDPFFSHRGQLRYSFAIITEDSNTHWCSRKKNHALTARGENFFNLKIRVNVT